MRIYDPVLDGLRSAVRYDRTYFDKIVASLLPLLEKLTTGKIAQLLARNYSDLSATSTSSSPMSSLNSSAWTLIGTRAPAEASACPACR